jgi:lysozyme family protein
MQQDLQTAFADILQWEGGWTQSPAEPGGASNWGVSMITFGDYRKKHGLAAPTFDDLKALTQNDAIAIYQENWVSKIDFDDIPVGVDLQLLNISINLGLVGGISLLQQELNIPITGKMDNLTIATLQGYNTIPKQASLAADLGAAWLVNKSHDEDWYKYHAGWSNRANSITNACLAMINGEIPITTAPTTGSTS